MFEGVIQTLKSVHGEAIIFKGDGSLSHEFVGIFDEKYVEVDPATGQAINTQSICILTLLEDLPAQPTNREEFVVRGDSYLVSRTELDGKGGIRIFLMEND